MGSPSLPGEVGEAEQQPRSEHQPRHRRRRPARKPWRWALLALAVIVVLAGAAAIRVATESVPPPAVSIQLAGSVQIPGAAPRLAWPASGSAALAGADGTEIGSSGNSTPVPIASIAKVMTAYLILRDHPLAAGSAGFNLTITPAEAADLPSRIAANQSVVTVHAGQVLTERDALQALLLPSADNIADDLAAFDAGSIPAFVTKMNQAARTLGLASTRFVDASGVNNGTVSDARDLVALGRAAMAIPTFASIVAEPSATVTGLGKLTNYNTLVGTDGFTGIKTGSTIAAGQALLFSVSRPVAGKTVELIGVVLEQHGSGVAGGALVAAKALADSYYSQLQERLVLPAGTRVATVSRVGRSAALTTTAPLNLVALPGSTVSLRVSIDTAQPGFRSATVRAAGALDSTQVTTGAWKVPNPGVGWKLSHLL